jgi:hypothetical protein
MCLLLLFGALGDRHGISQSPRKPAKSFSMAFFDVTSVLVLKFVVLD